MVLELALGAGARQLALPGDAVVVARNYTTEGEWLRRRKPCSTEDIVLASERPGIRHWPECCGCI